MKSILFVRLGCLLIFTVLAPIQQATPEPMQSIESNPTLLNQAGLLQAEARVPVRKARRDEFTLAASEPQSVPVPFLVDDLVTFVPILVSARTMREASGCPLGFVGKYAFDA